MARARPPASKPSSRHDELLVETDPAKAPKTWSRLARIAVSVALCLHFLAVLAGPFSLPPSMLGDVLRDGFHVYHEAIYLGHSYKFFAPDPGPSHLLRYELEFADGHREVGVLPSRQDHWPRLLYHRHFMLSEFVAMFPPSEVRQWEKLPLSPLQKAYARSYARHLLKSKGAKSAKLFLVEHELAEPDEVIQGKALDDPLSYHPRLLGEYFPEPSS